jgi:Protein of unknown function (DUF1643)
MRLLVILAGPPLTTTGQRTLRRLEALSAVMPGYVVTAANLCAAPAADLPALSTAAAEVDTWLHARDAIEDALRECDEFLAAWGLYSLVGGARSHRKEQLAWLANTARSLGHGHCWTVGGEPRHPSRWHQYVSDKHGRTTGGTFEERLRQVLIRTPLATVA